MNNNLNFGQAIEALKKGHKVAREGWNGKGMFLFLVPGSTFKVSRPPLMGVYEKGTEINYLSHIDMKTADEKVVPWLASQTDVLAEDWVVLSDEYVDEKIYVEADLVEFGLYILSGQRTRRIKETYNPDDTTSLEDRISQVYDADISWLKKNQ